MHKKLIGLLAVLVLCCTGTSIAQATALYSADASAILTITDIRGGSPADLIINGDAYVSLSDMQASGPATASASGSANVIATDPFAITVGDSLSQSSSVSGTANAGGSSDAIHTTDGIFDFFNLSANTFEVDLLLDYNLAASASLNDPVTEDALGLADITLFDTAGGFNYDDGVLADALTGIFDPPVSNIVPFTVLVAPGDINSVFLYVDATGYANATAVPEPAIFSLFGIGLVGLGFARRRRG